MTCCREWGRTGLERGDVSSPIGGNRFVRLRGEGEREGEWEMSEAVGGFRVEAYRIIGCDQRARERAMTWVSELANKIEPQLKSSDDGLRLFNRM